MSKSILCNTTLINSELFAENKDNIISFEIKSLIRLNIKGVGYRNILGNSFKNESYPNITIINGIKQDINNNIYYFNESINYVELSWYNNIVNCEFMFHQCNNITFIDLSEFNSSQVVSMRSMFSGCESLMYLNLSNFDTSNSRNMWDMFNGCFSLISLDVYNFNTSKVTNMWSLFKNCSSLKFLDVSNFNTSQVENMKHMFYFCDSLEYLNISNFDTSKVKDLSGMFDGCRSLTTLNLSNFNTSNVKNMEYLFNNCNSLKLLDISNFNTSLITRMDYMFNRLFLVTSLDLSSFNTSIVTNMEGMFKNCLTLKFLNISNFDTSKVENMICMFCQCSSLTFLNLSHFETSKVKAMQNMFENCSSLISLDIINFDTSKATSFDSLFGGCSSLISIDVSNFNTSQVKNMHRVFFNCHSLKVLDVSNFNTTLVRLMNNMFGGCYLLTSLNLSNFDTSEVTWFQWMFNGSSNLEYINMQNFNFKKYVLGNNMFDSVPDNLVICFNNIQNDTRLLNNLKNKKCFVNDCSSNWKLKKKKLININSINLINNITFFNICKCDIENCLLYSNDNRDLNNSLCNMYNFYPKENDIYNKSQKINCYKEEKGYYLDKIDLIFKKCYYTCDTCEIKGNNETHNCLTCDNNYPYEIKKYNYKNCYKKCNHYHFFDKKNNYFCTNEKLCPEEYNKLIPIKNECIDNCEKDDIYKYEFRKICYEKCPFPNSTLSNITKCFCEAVCSKEFPYKLIKTQECLKNCEFNDLMNNLCIFQYFSNDTKKETKEEEIEEKNKLIESVESSLTSGKINTSKLESGQQEKISNGNMAITITTTQNEKEIKKDNDTKVDLGECEITLRNYYNISKDKILYMQKIEVIQEGLKIPKVEINIYTKLNDSSLLKLNLSLCQNDKMEITLPIVLSDDIDKLNTSSGYFNDICYVSTSENGTDIILRDRKKEFIDNNKTVCQEDCDFTEYDYNIQKAKCSCKVKESSSSFEKINIDTKQIFENLLKI